MKTRILAACAAVLSLFGVSTALAVEGNPVQGIGVSVEQSPGGIMIRTEDCTTKKGGTLVKRADGKWICQLPVVAGASVITSAGPGGRPITGRGAGTITVTPPPPPPPAKGN